MEIKDFQDTGLRPRVSLPDRRGERKGCVGMSPFHYECGSEPDAQSKAMGTGNVFPRATLRSKAFSRA